MFDSTDASLIWPSNRSILYFTSFFNNSVSYSLIWFAVSCVRPNNFEFEFMIYQRKLILEFVFHEINRHIVDLFTIINNNDFLHHSIDFPNIYTSLICALHLVFDFHIFGLVNTTWLINRLRFWFLRFSCQIKLKFNPNERNVWNEMEYHNNSSVAVLVLFYNRLFH